MSSTGKSPSWENLLPPVEEEISEYHFKRFFEAMFLRQEVWYKKEYLKELPPWSNDEYFRIIGFTNVLENLDEIPQWEIHKIIRNEDLKAVDKCFKFMFLPVWSTNLIFLNF
jgi:hypothetical protein